MLTRGHVAIIPRADIQNIALSSAAIGHAILVSTLVEASIFREWILNVGRRDAKSRLAHVLCELAVRLDSNGLTGDMGYHLPMTQAELADALGLTPVHLNRVIRSLETDGLINRSKRELSFPVWERMRDMADFNVRYLHLAVQDDDRVPRPIEGQVSAQANQAVGDRLARRRESQDPDLGMEDPVRVLRSRLNDRGLQVPEKQLVVRSADRMDYLRPWRVM
jgi:DNA-binding Lrp family transcriptional regulator